MKDLHRIDLGPLGLEGEWVDIPARESWGVHSMLQDAQYRAGLGQPGALEQFRMQQINAYIARWSFPDEVNETSVRDLDADVAGYVVAQAEAWYGEVRRSPSDRKSESPAIREVA